MARARDYIHSFMIKELGLKSHECLRGEIEFNKNYKDAWNLWFFNDEAPYVLNVLDDNQTERYLKDRVTPLGLKGKSLEAFKKTLLYEQIKSLVEDRLSIL